MNYSIVKIRGGKGVSVMTGSSTQAIKPGTLLKKGATGEYGELGAHDFVGFASGGLPTGYNAISGKDIVIVESYKWDRDSSYVLNGVTFSSGNDRAVYCKRFGKRMTVERLNFGHAAEAVNKGDRLYLFDGKLTKTIPTYFEGYEAELLCVGYVNKDVLTSNLDDEWEIDFIMDGVVENIIASVEFTGVTLTNTDGVLSIDEYSYDGTPVTTPVFTYAWYGCDTEDGEYSLIEGEEGASLDTTELSPSYYKVEVICDGAAYGTEMSSAINGGAAELTGVTLINTDGVLSIDEYIYDGTPATTPVFTYAWYGCDTEDGEYSLIEGEESASLDTTELSSSYYKVEVTCDGAAYGTEMSSAINVGDGGAVS